MNVLLLCDYRPNGPATVHDHLDALEHASGHDVYRLSMLGDIPNEIELDRFDAVIVHYSLAIGRDESLSPLARLRLRRCLALKAAFIQDEYRWVDRTLDALDYMRVQVLFSCLPEPELGRVYASERLPHVVRREHVLTGYVPAGLTRLEVPGFAERPVDIGYRGRRLSAACGSLGREKHLIAQRFTECAGRYGLRADISCAESDRLYGDAWVAFVCSCKAMLGTESGASVMDYDGTIAAAVAAHESTQPETAFETLRDRYFPGLDGAVRMNQISPRCFESAALRTLMVLYEGHYSGILEPWRHYVPLRKDHSNEREVVTAIRDPGRWLEITQRAYTEIACDPRHGYAAFGRRVGEILREEAARLSPRASRPGPSRAAFHRVAQEHARRVADALRKTDTLSALHVAFERRLLAVLPRGPRRVLERVVRSTYHQLARAWRYGRVRWATVRGRRRLAGIPPGMLLAPWLDELWAEVAVIDGLRAFGTRNVRERGEAVFSVRRNHSAGELEIEAVGGVFDDDSAAADDYAGIRCANALVGCSTLTVVLGSRDPARVNGARNLQYLGRLLAARPGLAAIVLGGPERDLAWLGIGSPGRSTSRGPTDSESTGKE